MDYKNQITTSANQEIAFYAIAKHVNQWWGKVDHPISKMGEEFSIYFGETEWRFKIIEYAPFEKITWHCIKATHIHGNITDIEEEWLNSKLYWEIIDKEGKTEVSFTHTGLTPALNCFDVCRKGWDYFISTSLKNYLDSGKGNPHVE